MKFRTLKLAQKAVFLAILMLVSLVLLVVTPIQKSFALGHGEMVNSDLSLLVASNSAMVSNDFKIGDLTAICINAGLSAPDDGSIYHQQGDSTTFPHAPQGSWSSDYGLTGPQMSYVISKLNTSDNIDRNARNLLIHFNYEEARNFTTPFGKQNVTQTGRLSSMYDDLTNNVNSGEGLKIKNRMKSIVSEARQNATSSHLSVGTLEYGQGLTAVLKGLSISGDQTSTTLVITGPGTFSDGSTTKTVSSGDQPVIKFTGPGVVTVSASVESWDDPTFEFWTADNNKFQSVITNLTPAKGSSFDSTSIKAIWPVTIGIEKALSFSTGTAPKLVTDSDANNLTALNKVVFGLFDSAGNAINWDNKDYILSGSKPAYTFASYDMNGSQEAKYYSNGKVVTTRPTSGPVQIVANDDGKAYFNHLVGDKTYMIKEVVRPDYVTKELKSTTLDTKALTPDKHDADQVGVFERFMGEESHSDLTASDNGFYNEFKKFSVKARKYYSLNGYTFKDDSILKINQEKNPFKDIAVKILKADGKTPLKWSDKQMYFIKKEKTKYLTAGKFLTSGESDDVEIGLDDKGTFELKGLLTLDQSKYYLQEARTSKRSHVAFKPIELNAESANDETLRNGKHLDNALDYTGVTLTKKGNYLGTQYDAHLAQASFEGATYGLFYGDGPHKDKPVMTGDYAVEASIALKSGTKDTDWLQDGQVRWVGKKNQPFSITLSNVLWGSYYIKELAAGTGHHLDVHRYYFGDKTEMPADSVYLEPEVKTGDNGVEGKISAKATNITVDDVKLLSSELEKREALIHTDSPFMTSSKPSWGGSKKPVYSFAEVKNDYIGVNSPFGEKKLNEVGRTSLSGNVYQLYYAADFTDSDTTKVNTPVKWDDPAVKHLEIVKGTRAAGFDGVAVATGADKDLGRIAVKNIAYGSYYWKEVKTSPGLSLDPKEYYFGAPQAADTGKGSIGNYAGSTDANAPYNVTTAETQTNAESSKADHKLNWMFMNTFDDGRNAGSTDYVLTVGFSSKKLAKNENVEENGEDGVALTLTPIEGTKGYPITTKSFTQYVQDNSGKTTANAGYFEFRTIPFGRYLMTSDGSESDKASAAVKLLEIAPIIVDVSETGKTYADRGYKLSFYLDTDEDSKLSEGDELLTTFDSKSESAIPNQSQFNALTAADTPSNTAEKYAWMRTDYKDVNSDGLKNNNFISGEANVDLASFEVNDLPNDSSMKLKTTATTPEGGKTVLANQPKVDLVDKVEFKFSNPEKQATFEKGIPYTLRAVVVQSDEPEKLVSEYSCKEFTWSNQKSIDVPLTINTDGLHGKKVVVFERLYQGHISDCSKTPGDDTPLINTHENPSDEGQTINVEHDGKIHTTATSDTGSKVIIPDKNQTIYDTIDLSESNLMNCGIYSINAKPVLPFREGLVTNGKDPITFDKLPSKVNEMTLVTDENKQTAIAVPFDKAEVVRDSKLAVGACVNDKEKKDIILKPEEFVYHTGMKNVKVKISGINMETYKPKQKVVMFEKVTGDTIKPMVHADINDRNQTVTIEPTLRTNLYNKVQEKEVKTYKPGTDVEFIDKVQARGISALHKYTATLDLMTPTTDKALDKADGEEDGMTFYRDANGKKVTKTVTLNVEKSNVDYSIYVKFKANDKLEKIVAYETLTEVPDKPKTPDTDKPDKPGKPEKPVTDKPDKPVEPSNTLKHHNPKDKNQTVTPEKPVTPVHPAKPDKPAPKPKPTPKPAAPAPAPKAAPKRHLPQTGAMAEIALLGSFALVTIGCAAVLSRRLKRNSN